MSDAAIQDQVDILDDIPDDIYCNLVETLNEKCLETSLLEIWKYNEEVIRGSVIFCQNCTLMQFLTILIGIEIWESISKEKSHFQAF